MKIEIFDFFFFNILKSYENVEILWNFEILWKFLKFYEILWKLKFYENWNF